MKPTIQLLLAVLLWSAASALVMGVEGNPSRCESIRDADRRHFCRAVTIPRASECELIRSADLRAECRARAPR